MLIRFYRPAALVLSLLCLVPDGASAQSLLSPSEETAYMHHYARPGRATISVYVWGTVEFPGIWRVEREVDLVEFLSALRVPEVGQSDARTSRRTVLRIYRKAANQRSMTYQASLDELLTQQAIYPTLEDEDVLQVETISRKRLGWRDIGTIVGTVSSLVLLALRVSDL